MRPYPLLLLLGAMPLLADAPPPAIPIAARAPGVASLSPDTEARWVPFDLTPGNQIRFGMTLDGKPVVAILDTGVSYSVLARSSPVVNKPTLQPGGSATAIGGAVAIDWMPTRELQMGGLTRRGGGVTVAELPAIATGSSKAVDLLVGRDMIGDQALDIDYDGRRFRVLPSGRLPFAGVTAPLTISPDRRIYESEMVLGGRRLRPMVVDTGDGSAITVTQPAWRAAGLNQLPGTTAISFGLAGPVVSELTIVPALNVGQLAARQVEVRAEPTGGFSQTIGTAGRIGSGFLQNYRVLLDPTARRMVFQPGAKAGQPPLRSTSGLLVALAGTRLRILHVMRNSPAAATGWRDGDEICRVDGQPVAANYASSPMAAWSIGAPGTRVALEMCDGTTRSLTLQRFY